MAFITNITHLTAIYTVNAINQFASKSGEVFINVPKVIAVINNPPAFNLNNKYGALAAKGQSFTS